MDLKKRKHYYRYFLYHIPRIMPMNKVFSFPKLTQDSAKPITDFIKSSKPKTERRRKDRKSSGTKKRNSHNDLFLLASNAASKTEKKKRSSANDLSRYASNELDESEVDDIYNMVRQLKDSSEGQELLSEFVNYQTGKTSRKPRLLEEDDFFIGDGSDSGPPPLSEIQIVLGK